MRSQKIEVFDTIFVFYWLEESLVVSLEKKASSVEKSVHFENKNKIPTKFVIWRLFIFFNKMF